MPDIQMESRSHGWHCADHLVASTGGMLCKDQSTRLLHGYSKNCTSMSETQPKSSNMFSWKVKEKGGDIQVFHIGCLLNKASNSSCTKNAKKNKKNTIKHNKFNKTSVLPAARFIVSDKFTLTHYLLALL